MTDVHAPPDYSPPSENDVTTTALETEEYRAKNFR